MMHHPLVAMLRNAQQCCRGADRADNPCVEKKIVAHFFFLSSGDLSSSFHALKRSSKGLSEKIRDWYRFCYWEIVSYPD